MLRGRPRADLIRRAACAVLVGAAALSSGACSVGLGTWSGGSTTEHHDVADIEVSTDTEQEPDVTVPAPFSVTETVRDVVVEGDGAEVESGMRVTVDYVGVNGTSGEVFESSWEDSPSSFVIDSGDYVMQGVVDGLEGVTVGSRVLVAIPAEDAYGLQGASDRGIGPTDTIVFVMDVESARTVLTKATGTKVAAKKGLPTVTRAKNGKPTLHISGTAPTSLTAQPLIKGKGAEVAKGQSITVHYVGEVWSTGTVFDTTWTKDPSPRTFTIGTGAVIAGWDDGLVGQTVGSQVLLVVPPDDGYGAEGNSDYGIGGTDVIVFVVDILDAA